MAWTLSYHLLPLSAAAAVSLTLFAVIWQNRQKSGAGPLLIIIPGIVGWTGVSIIQIASNEPWVVRTSGLVIIGFIPLTAVGWFLFATVYTSKDQWRSRRILAGLLSVPILTQLFVLTQAVGAHSLVYTELTVQTVNSSGGTLLLADSDRGSWFYIHTVHSYSFLVAGSYLVVRSAIGTWSVYRAQAVAMLVAVTAPVIANVLRLTGVTAVDYTPFGFGISAVAVAWALFRYELLDLVPIARETVIEEMRDAVVVLDTQGRIVDANEAASPIVGVDTVDNIIGKDASDVLPFTVDPYLVNPDGGWQELRLDHGDTPAHYRLESTPLSDRRGRQTGTLLVFQDITAMKRREQELRETSEELELLNRVVRHDIQNDMNVVAGHAQFLEAEIDDESLQTHVEPIRHNSEHAIELTETVRDLVRSTTDSAELDLEPVDLHRVVEEEVEKAQQTYDDLTIEFDPSDERVTVFANSMLSSVFKNLFSNAVRHNDTGAPEIDVSVTTVDARVQIRVADNGPGIPDDRKETVFGRGEKGLDSPGTGVGLYLVDTLVTRYGGTVTIEDNEPRGAAFVVELPTAD